MISSLSLAQPLAGHLSALLVVFAHPSLSSCIALGPAFFLFTGSLNRGLWPRHQTRASPGVGVEPQLDRDLPKAFIFSIPPEQASPQSSQHGVLWWVRDRPECEHVCMSVPQHTVGTLPVPLGNPEPHLQVLWSKVSRRLDLQKTGRSQDNPTQLLSF